MALAEFIYTRLLRPAPVRRAANAILLSIVPETVRVGPAIVHLNPRDPVVSGALALRVFERDELRFFSQRCRPGMTVLDVGANVGLYTALAMNLTGADGTVVAIEPHAESRRFLELTVQANAATRTPVHVFDCAGVRPRGNGRAVRQPAKQSRQSIVSIRGNVARAIRPRPTAHDRRHTGRPRGARSRHPQD